MVISMKLNTEEEQNEVFFLAEENFDGLTASNLCIRVNSERSLAASDGFYTQLLKLFNAIIKKTI